MQGENVRLMERDMALAKGLKHERAEGLTGCISREALMNAVRSEGVQVLSTAAKGYWDDMKRRYPHLNLSGRKAPTGSNLIGTCNRFGPVAWRTRMADGKPVHERFDKRRREWVAFKPESKFHTFVK